MAQDLQYFGFRPQALHKRLIELRDKNNLTHTTICHTLKQEMHYIQTLDELLDRILDNEGIIHPNELDTQIKKSIPDICKQDDIHTVHTLVRDHFARIPKASLKRSQFITTLQNYGDRIYMMYHTIKTQLETESNQKPHIIIDTLIMNTQTKKDPVIHRFLLFVFDTIFEKTVTPHR